MKRWLRTLSGRTTLATTAVAIVAVLVTATASLPLISFALEQQARQELTAATAALAAQPPAALAAAVAVSGPGRTRLAIIRPGGSAEGSAAPLLAPRLRVVVLAGGTVSTTVTNPAGDRFVLVARPLPDGGGIAAAQEVGDVQRTNAAIVLAVLIALGLGLVVAVGVGAPLARAIARPLRRTAQTAHRIAAGERGLVVPTQHIAEIDEIGVALGALDRDLSTSEQRQREFLLSVSHELRTPLTAVHGYAEALADGLVAPEEARDVGRTLVDETLRLDRFVADLLALARLEADDFTLTPADVNVSDLVGEAVRAWSGRARLADVALTAQVPDGLRATVRTDPGRARQLVDGLIENALRAAPAGGVVIVAVVDERCVEVRDSGPGLTPDDLAHAFDRGVLRERYREQRAVGTGLGLSIATRLASRLGAVLTAGTAAEGGAAFRVRFPASPTPE